MSIDKAFHYQFAQGMFCYSASLGLFSLSLFFFGNARESELKRTCVVHTQRCLPFFFSLEMPVKVWVEVEVWIEISLSFTFYLLAKHWLGA